MGPESPSEAAEVCSSTAADEMAAPSAELMFAETSADARLAAAWGAAAQVDAPPRIDVHRGFARRFKRCAL